MRVAVFGDVHLARMRMHPWHLLSKRVLGMTNKLVNRKRAFRHDLLPAMVNEAVAAKPDVVLFTGDVTTTSLLVEFDLFQDALAPLIHGREAVFVPGNHDAYTLTAHRLKRAKRRLTGLMPKKFPHYQALSDRWNLLALDAAIPTLFGANGKLGPDQLAKTLELIDHAPADAGLIVLCHWPIWVPKDAVHPRIRALNEDAKLLDALKQCKSRVVTIHGHIHRPWHHAPSHAAPEAAPEAASDQPQANAGGAVPFDSINAGSPCATSRTYPHGQGYWLIDLPDDPRAPLGAAHQPGRKPAAPSNP